MKKKPSIRIAIADDHRLVRDGIKSLLHQNERIEIIGEAEDGEAAAKIAEIKKPEIFLLDISMPVLNGLEALKAIRILSPNTRVLMLSMHEEPEYIIKSLKLGASGYLLKSVEEKELRHAIEEVYLGKIYLQSGIAQGVLERMTKAQEGEEKLTPPEVPALSSRERQVLEGIVSGLSAKQIATKLFISPRTVEVHRANISRKLGAQNTAELVKIAIQFGLIES
ncbi:MAG: response regulator transcription factor [Chloroherpetonaceae bacterium]|nr:response regulator transcription factor [Chloroherpetonaceae bacterium]